MTVAKICSREVDTAQPEEFVDQIAQRMHARKVGSLVVTNSNKVPIGMITDRDLVTRVIVANRDPRRTVLQDVMSPHPATIQLDGTVVDALRIMRAHQCRRIPVVNALGTMVGVLSLDDVLGHVADEFELIGELLREESPKSLADEL